MELSHDSSNSEAVSAASQPIAARIPPEILTEIVGLLPRKKTNCSIRWNEFPWPYTYVCRYWRHVLIAAPHLWTTIAVGDSYPRKRRLRAGYEHRSDHLRVALQLERTGTMPLVIVTETESFYDPKVLQLLALRHSRWKVAHLDFYKSDMGQLLSSAESWSFNDLRQLTIRLDEGGDISATNGDPFMPKAPKLETLRLVLLQLNAPSFPWTQLTTLALTYVYTTTDQIRQVLSQCTSLGDLELDELMVQDEVELPSTRVTLPLLESFSYNASDQDGELLFHLHTPALKELMIQSGAQSEELKSYFLSSSPPLQSLQLDLSNWTTETTDTASMAEIFRLIPTIEFLRISSQHTDESELDTILKLLDWSGDYKLCPNLFSLTLTPVTFSQASAESFVQMLASRSVATYHENTAVLNTAREMLDAAAGLDLSNNEEEARSVLRKVNDIQRDLKSLVGLKALLGQLVVRCIKPKEESFSEAQLARIKVLTAGMLQVKLKM